MNIFITNLSFHVKDDELRSLFTPFGIVVSAKVIYDIGTRRSKGFGFVEMLNRIAALEAIGKLHQSMVAGRAITVTETSPKPEKANDMNANRQEGGFFKLR